MAAWRSGRLVVEGLCRKRFLSTGVWLCAALLPGVVCLGGAGLRGVRAQAAQQPQAASGQEPAAQPSAQSTDSSSAQTDDGAQELLKEFPADSASKAANDPRDGHTDTPPGATPFADTAAEEDVPQPGGTAGTQPVVAAAPTPPALIELPSDPKQRQVAIVCNDLLTMATDLKTAVDKSTKDQLSLDVVRKAGQIEQYARKVRAATAQTAGK